MRQEIVTILIFAAAIVAYGLFRRRQERRSEADVQRRIVCEVTYRDRQRTQAFLEACVAENQISVLSVNCFFEDGEDDDLYTNVYKLLLPEGLTAAQLVGLLSECETVQSVHTKME